MREFEINAIVDKVYEETIDAFHAKEEKALAALQKEVSVDVKKYCKLQKEIREKQAEQKRIMDDNTEFLVKHNLNIDVNKGKLIRRTIYKGASGMVTTHHDKIKREVTLATMEELRPEQIQKMIKDLVKQFS